MDVAELLKLAQATNMTATELREMMDSIAERNERAAQREERRLAMEREEKEKEREEKEKERVEREKERAHQLELASLKNEKPTQNPGSESEDELPRGYRPKIPPFADSDEMDAYLQRFERLASLYRWKDSDYAIYLGTLLRGKALKVYVSLPPEVSEDYQELKKALLLAYHVDANSYRRKFKEGRVGDNESYVQLALRMEQYLDRWVTLNKIDKSYDALGDLLIRDQIIANAPYDLRIFLKERKFSDTLSMAEAADMFRNAHRPYKSKIDKKKTKADAKDDSKEKDVNDKHAKLTCHYCGDRGHISPNCPKNPRNFKNDKVNFVFNREIKPVGSFVDQDAKLFTKNVEVTLDTGCNTVVVKDTLIDKSSLGRETKIYDYLGIGQYFPTARIWISCKYFKGWVTAVVAPIKFSDVLLGMIPGVKVPQEEVTLTNDSTKHDLPSMSGNAGVSDLKTDKTASMAVQTRASKAKDNLKLKSLVDSEVINANRDSFIKAQSECSSLDNIKKETEYSYCFQKQNY